MQPALLAAALGAATLSGATAVPSCIRAAESGFLALEDDDVAPKETSSVWWWHFPHGPSVGAVGEKQTPLLLWLIGGPGGAGARDATYQGGPCLLENGTLVENPNSIPGQLGLDILYLDEWEGAGYSGGGQPVAVTANQTARRIVSFLSAWVRQHPGESDAMRDFYIMGYSAAGQYLPIVAKHILEGALPLTLRGIAMGNGLIDPLTQIPTWGEFLHENKLINATTLARFNRQYRFGCQRALLQGNWSAANDECWTLSSYCPTPDNLNIHGALHSHDIFELPRQQLF
eukprot:COSAG02_NODE_288_length_25612_cov_29.808529_14_plen_287_part_00